MKRWRKSIARVDYPRVQIEHALLFTVNLTVDNTQLAQIGSRLDDLQLVNHESLHLEISTALLAGDGLIRGGSEISRPARQTCERRQSLPIFEALSSTRAIGHAVEETFQSQTAPQTRHNARHALPTIVSPHPLALSRGSRHHGNIRHTHGSDLCRTQGARSQAPRELLSHLRPLPQQPSSHAGLNPHSRHRELHYQYVGDAAFEVVDEGRGCREGQRTHIARGQLNKSPHGWWTCWYQASSRAPHSHRTPQAYKQLPPPCHELYPPRQIMFRGRLITRTRSAPGQSPNPFERTDGVCRFHLRLSAGRRYIEEVSEACNHRRLSCTRGYGR